MSIDYDILGFMKFVDRDDWHEHLNTVLEDHFVAAIDAFKIEFAEISLLLDGQAR